MTSVRLLVPWWRQHWPIVLLLIGMLVIILDRRMPVHTEIVLVERADEFSTRLSSRGMRTIDRWSVVHLDDGRVFQTQRAVGSFPVGALLEIRSTALLNTITAYRPPAPGRSDWRGLESDSEALRPFPYVIAMAALALLFPLRNAQTRWLVVGILGVCMFLWCVGLGSMNLLRLFSW